MERMSGQMIEYARGRFSREAMRSVLSDSLRPQRPAAAAPPRTAAVLADGVRAGA
jgi:hypothetical protein